MATAPSIPWWEEPIAVDIHQALLDKEETLRPFKGQSPQLDQRRFLVDWLAVICEEYGVCNDAKHLAVYLLDHFMDHFEIDLERIHLVVLGCLLVACKFEETEINIPRWHHLDRFIIRSEYEYSHYLHMELLLLDFFNWNICIPTASSFANYYIAASLIHERQSMSNPVWVEKVEVYMEKYVKYFLEISLQDHTYRFHKPSLVAVACVAASRACMQLTPIWPDALSSVTSHPWDEVSVPLHTMLLSYQVDDKATRESTCTPSRGLHDSGYSSPESGAPSPTCHLDSLTLSAPASPTQLDLVSNFNEEMVL